MTEQNFTLKQYLLFKIDRNLAILGMVAVVVVSVLADLTEIEAKIASSALTGLGVYAGTRGGNK